MNIEERRAKQREYYHRNKDKYKIWHSNPEVRKRRNKVVNGQRRQFRISAIEQFGGKCSRCAFEDWRALQIDHVQGWGSEERRSFKDTYSYLKHCLADTTGKYQLLCANCNWIKRYEQYEEKGRIKYED